MHLKGEQMVTKIIFGDFSLQCWINVFEHPWSLSEMKDFIKNIHVKFKNKVYEHLNIDGV